MRKGSNPSEGTVFTGRVNATVQVPQFAVSPDEHALVFVAAAPGASPLLWLRRLDEVVAHMLPGTEGAAMPFRAPDNHWIGLLSDGKIKRVSESGRPVQVVLARGVGPPRGAAWSSGDVILFGADTLSLNRVPASGGPVTSVTKRDVSLGEGQHTEPSFLPDGQHFLFTIRAWDRGGIYAGSLDGRLSKRLIDVDSSAVYASSGYLLWVGSDTLLGQAFDAGRMSSQRAAVLTGQESLALFGRKPVPNPNSYPAHALHTSNPGSQFRTEQTRIRGFKRAAANCSQAEIDGRRRVLLLFEKDPVPENHGTIKCQPRL